MTVWERVSSMSGQLKVAIVAVFALAAGLVAVFDLGALAWRGLGYLPGSKAPAISVFHNGAILTPDADGYRVTLAEKSVVQVQIGSNSEVPTLVQGVFLHPEDADRWQPLDQRIEQPAHGSIEVSQVVIKPREGGTLDVFSVRDGLVRKRPDNRLIAGPEVRTISSEVEDLLLIDLKSANAHFKTFCTRLLVEYRFETEGTEDVSKRICFAQD